MKWQQPIEEKLAERELIISFAKAYSHKIEKIVRMQGEVDDTKEDAVFRFWDGREIGVEARRKGYKNHRGESYDFYDGWDTPCLKRGVKGQPVEMPAGIFLNERTLRNHIGKKFIFIVEIKGCNPRCAILSSERINECLLQPFFEQRSTNSGNPQSVKSIPLEWHNECLSNWNKS